MNDLLCEWLNNNRCEMKEKGITEKRYDDIIYDSIIYNRVDHESANSFGQITGRFSELNWNIDLEVFSIIKEKMIFESYSTGKGKMDAPQLEWLIQNYIKYLK